MSPHHRHCQRVVAVEVGVFLRKLVVEVSALAKVRQLCHDAVPDKHIAGLDVAVDQGLLQFVMKISEPVRSPEREAVAQVFPRSGIFLEEGLEGSVAAVLENDAELVGPFVPPACVEKMDGSLLMDPGLEV